MDIRRSLVTAAVLVSGPLLLVSFGGLIWSVGVGKEQQADLFRAFVAGSGILALIATALFFPERRERPCPRCSASLYDAVRPGEREWRETCFACGYESRPTLPAGRVGPRVQKRPPTGATAGKNRDPHY